MRHPPTIDVSLDHYMEERALAIALEKAATPEERRKVERLVDLRSRLMKQREAYLNEATARRHARGERYSRSQIAAINEMAPSRVELDAYVKTLYAPQPDSTGVLKAHARTHFVHALVPARLMLADLPPDIVEAARLMQEHEERFARAWLAAIGDPAFDAELREQRRQALTLFRGATRPVYLVTDPAREVLTDDDARELGKSWARLDRLASSLGAKPLSSFIAFEDEGEGAGAPANEILPIVEALISAIKSPRQKFPSKRSAIAVLTKIRAGLVTAAEKGARAHFEVDI